MKVKYTIHSFFIFVVVTLSFMASTATANNLQFDNFAVVATDETTNTITFTADVSWENSWRNVTNYDAIWVFLKYSTDAGLSWSHARMASSGENPVGFEAPSGFEIIVPVDEQGFFLQRTDFNTGNATATSVQFVWDYGQDGLSDAEGMAANTINKIFGVEMVYVPEGAFYAGDGNSSSSYRFKEGSSDNDPWYIQNESAITTTNGASNGFYYSNTGASSEDSSGAVFLLPSSYPKGYNDYYLMKYELTEGQWVGFFNTLSSAGKSTRDITSAIEGGKNSDAVTTRNTISWDSSLPTSEATTTRPDRPVSYISWPDILAYADWAGLRPFTELEYEKAARGKDIFPVANEFVWGKASFNEALASEIYPDADEDGSEEIFDGSANINRNSLSWSTGDGRGGGAAAGQAGPLRVGIFAESSTNRATSGAGYYGAMELSGNLSEMLVTVGKQKGRQFLGSHGDGNLSTLSGYEGNATNTDWPGINAVDAARGVTGTEGSGYRGGDFSTSDGFIYQLSTRTNAVKDADGEGNNQRYDGTAGIYAGGRLARTAP